VAHSFLRHYPADRMRDWPAPAAARAKAAAPSPNLELF